MTGTPDNDHSIAIVGMAGRFPGIKTIDELWLHLKEGAETIRPITGQFKPGIVSSSIQRFVNVTSSLDDAELFDASFFGYSPRQAAHIDPQQRLFLECCWEALEHSGHMPENFDGAVGVFAGSALNTYVISQLGDMSAFTDADLYQLVMECDKDYLATRASYKLNLTGPSITVQTACSTSLVAVHLACQSLLNYECDMVLAGGVSIRFPQNMAYVYQEGGVLSPDGRCRAFDADAKGMVPGDGAGVVVLRRLNDAIESGDCIHAVIIGSATNNDGDDKVSYTAPGFRGQTEAISAALALAGVEADTIGYIEGHGTGTHLGDAIELSALTEVFKSRKCLPKSCAIGSSKTNLGHLDVAAGIAGLLKTALCLKNRALVPSLNFNRPHPVIATKQSPFYVNTRFQPWPARGLPRRAAVSSFGIGGTNAHMILQEPPDAQATEDCEQHEIFPQSARTPHALDETRRRLGDYLRTNSSIGLAHVAFTLQTGRRHFTNRAFAVANSMNELLTSLDKPVCDQAQTQRTVIFQFPGQGVRLAGVASHLYRTESSFQADVETCSALLKRHLDFDVRDVLCDSAKENIDDTYPTLVNQPCIFILQYCLAQLWLRWGIKPAAMIGHSIGEYSAACVSGAIALEDAIELVAARAVAMDRLPGGAMVVINCTERELIPFLPPELSLAAVNGPSQCVASGPTAQIEGLMATLAKRDVSHRLLPVSHAFHSKVMEPAAKEIVELARRIKVGSVAIPYISCLTGTWISGEQVSDPHYWGAHMCGTVRFGEGLTELTKDPRRIFLELGPGRVLTSLIRRGQHQAGEAHAISSLPHGSGNDRAALLDTLGDLWVKGATIDWLMFARGSRRRRIPLPTYPFERSRHRLEPIRAGSNDDRRPFDRSRSTNRDERRTTPQFYTPTWKTSPNPRPVSVLAHGSEDECWLVVADRFGLGEMIASRLTELGATVFTLLCSEDSFRLQSKESTLQLGDIEDYDRVLHELSQRRMHPRHLVHCASLGCDESRGSMEDFMARQRSGYCSVLRLAQALSRNVSKSPVKLVIVTNQLAQLQSSDTCLPEKATLLGLCKVIPQELSNAQSIAIDVPVLKDAGDEGRRNRTYVDWIIAEARETDDAHTVAYRGGLRFSHAMEPLNLKAEGAPLRRLRPNGVYLIIGGLGRVGLTLARFLAEEHNAKLVLVGRTEMPSRDTWHEYTIDRVDGPAPMMKEKIAKTISALLEIEAMGSELLLARADVCDALAVETLVGDAERRFGPIHGVFHLAGETGHPSAFNLIDTAICSDLETQARPKVAGLYTLTHCFRDRNLDFGIVFSSNASVLGGIGFSAYSAANAFVDFAVSTLRQGRFPWFAINWDGWDEVTAEDEAHGDRRRMGVRIRSDDAIKALSKIISCSTVPQIAVSTTNLESRMLTWLFKGRTQEAHSIQQDLPNRSGAECRRSSQPPRTALEQKIARVWEEILGIAEIGVDEEFFDLGGDSLIGLRIITRLREAFNVEIVLKDLLQDRATISGLARQIVARLVRQGGDRGAAELAAVTARRK